MRKYFLYFISALAGMFLFFACKKDTGNYTYKEINELKFTGFDTLNGYTVDAGDTLVIDPGIAGTLDKDITGTTYEWRLIQVPSQNYVISTESKLNLKVTILPGTYSLVCKVTDSKTGISWIKQTVLNVTTAVYEGFMVMNKVNDTTRLDFLSYKTSTNSFVQYTNVLEKLGVNMPPAGAPYQLGFLKSRFVTYFLVMTSAETSLLDPESMAYNPAVNLSLITAGHLPAGFKATSASIRGGNNIFGMAWLFDGNHNGIAAPNFMTRITFTGSPMNYYSDQTRFDVAPFKICDQWMQLAVLYDQTNKRFVTEQNQAFTCDPIDPTLNFPEGKDLLYMTDDNGDTYYGTGMVGSAVLKEPGQEKYYMLRFSYTLDPNSGLINLAKTYYEEITATDFSHAENFAVSPDLGYLFYYVGGKLYEYDIFLKKSKLMLDMGSEKISFIRFDPNANGQEDWKKWLMVGSYDPAGEEGNNGKLALYSVPPVNGALVKQNEWTGMGQVVSVVYRYRHQ